MPDSSKPTDEREEQKLRLQHMETRLVDGLFGTFRVHFKLQISDLAATSATGEQNDVRSVGTAA